VLPRDDGNHVPDYRASKQDHNLHIHRRKNLKSHKINNISLRLDALVLNEANETMKSGSYTHLHVGLSEVDIKCVSRLVLYRLRHILQAQGSFRAHGP
jgi:hypothetical protein